MEIFSLTGHELSCVNRRGQCRLMSAHGRISTVRGVELKVRKGSRAVGRRAKSERLRWEASDPWLNGGNGRDSGYNGRQGRLGVRPKHAFIHRSTSKLSRRA